MFGPLLAVPGAGPLSKCPNTMSVRQVTLCCPLSIMCGS